MSLKYGILLALIAGIVFPAIGQQLAPSPSPADISSPDGQTAATPAQQPTISDPPAQTMDLSGGAARPAAVRAPQVPADAPRTQRNGIDETALRYFAGQGDTRRLEAEIARLRALYPNWTPPDEIGEAEGDPELERMWKLYADGKYADVRGAVAQRLADDPSWVVPDDLLQRLDEAENRQRLVNASDAGQWNQVLNIATDTPTLLTCDSVDMLWRVADAFAKTGKSDRALSAYSYVLQNCSNPAERVATVQKALEVLADADVDQLMRFERNNEFEPVRDDLARRRVNAAALDPKKTASQDDLSRLERLARDDGNDVDDAMSLGWYFFHHQMTAGAYDWFKLAFDRNGGARAAEGLVYTMTALDRLLEAEPIGYQWRTSSPDNLKAYLDLMVTIFSQDDPPLKVEPDILNRFAAVLNQVKYALGAQAVGFYAYNTSQFSTAARWFQTALKWQPDMEPAAYGLALCGIRVPNREIFNDIVAVWRDRSARIFELTLPPGQQLPRRQSPPQLGDLSQPITILPSPAPNLAYGPGYRPATTTRGIYNYQLPPQQVPPLPYAPMVQQQPSPYAPQLAYGGAAPYPMMQPGPYSMAQTGNEVTAQVNSMQPRVVQNTMRGSTPTFSGGLMPTNGYPTSSGSSPGLAPPGRFLPSGGGADAAMGTSQSVDSAGMRAYAPQGQMQPTMAPYGIQPPPQPYAPPMQPTYPSAVPMGGGPMGGTPMGGGYAPRRSDNMYAPALRGAGDPVAYEYDRPPPRPTMIARAGATAGYLASAQIVDLPSNTYTANASPNGGAIRLAQALPSSAPPTAGVSGPNTSNTISGVNAIANQGGATYASPGTYKPTSPQADYYGVATNYTPAASYRAPRVAGRRGFRGGGGGGGGASFSPAAGCRSVPSGIRPRLSGASALALGWCLMELDRPLEATDAFNMAVETSTGRIREEAAYGKTIAYLRKGLTNEAALSAAQSPLSVNRSVQLGANILAQRATAFYADKRYVETIIALDERARLVPEQTDLMVIRGFSYLELGRYTDAQRLFKAVQRTGTNRAATSGVIAVLQRTRQIREF